MKTATLNSDEALKTMVAEAVKQQTQIRSAVCDIMLKALQARELGLSQINNVVRNVTQGVNAGLGDKGDVEKVLADAVAGMDDALLKVVEANQVALTKLTEGGASFEESGVKKALDELEKLEDRFRAGITQGTQEAGARLSQQWASVLDKIPPGGTDTGERVLQTITTHAQQAKDAMTQSREAGLKVAHTLAQNYATLVSGVLMGLSEAMKHGKTTEQKIKWLSRFVLRRRSKRMMPNSVGVLLIEDDPAVLLGTQQTLQLAGFEVESFADAESAIKIG